MYPEEELNARPHPILRYLEHLILTVAKMVLILPCYIRSDFKSLMCLQGYVLVFLLFAQTIDCEYFSKYNPQSMF